MKTPTIYQHPEYGVGNFINCTPAIVGISRQLGQRVKVHFTLSHVRELYFPPVEKVVNRYMELLEEEPEEYLFGSNETNDAVPDWLYLYKKYAMGIYGCPREPPHTWVPPPHAIYTMLPFPSPYCCIVRGARSEFWHDKKDPGDGIYNYIIARVVEAGITPVLIGDQNDKRWWFNEMATWDSRIKDKSGGNIRRAVELIQHSNFVIANDTGLYHVAAALKKPTFVFWKHTHFVKNQAPPAAPVCYSQFGRWKRDFDRWFEGFVK